MERLIPRRFAYQDLDEQTKSTSKHNKMEKKVESVSTLSSGLNPANDTGNSLADSRQPLEESGDENKERGNWSSQVDFLLSCLGYAVGLGNVWRFPYICGQNGGGAFFIPYIIMLAFVGMPVFYMELSMGQFSSEGPLTVWKISPLFSGIGYGMIASSFFVAIYYNVIIAWTLYYLFASFQSVLPWTGCDNYWNTDDCYDIEKVKECNDQGFLYYRKVCYNDTAAHLFGVTTETVKNANRSTPSEEYFNYRVMKIDKENPGLAGMGAVDWEIVLCLLLAWILVCGCLCKGIKSSGKVVYFTATFPYVVLLVLLILGSIQDGAVKGIQFYIVPKFSKLRDPRVWTDAAGQIFFSLSCGGGGLVTLASYNRFRNNCYRDTMIVTIGNCATSVFAGFVIFSIIGFMAHQRGIPVQEIAGGGTGLAFVAYPEAVSLLPVPQLWSILFFFMLLTLGLDSQHSVALSNVYRYVATLGSFIILTLIARRLLAIFDMNIGIQFVMVEVANTAVLDYFHSLRPYKTWTMVVISVVMFLLALPMCMKGGIFLHQLVDQMAAGWCIIILCFLELCAITLMYDMRPLVTEIMEARQVNFHTVKKLAKPGRFCEDIAMMIGYSPNIYWRFCWRIASPLLLFGIIIFSFVDYRPLKYGNDYTYSSGAQAMAWLIALSSILMVPLVAIVEMCLLKKSNMSFFEKLNFLSKPTPEWGPALDKFRTGIYMPMGKELKQPHKPIYSLDQSGTKSDQAYLNPAYTHKNNAPVYETNI